MAIGYLKVSTISRGRGATACARMAYVCRARIADPRTEIMHDYRRKRDDVEAVGVVGWKGDAASLAAEMSKSEKRKDACEGRSIIVALPHELDADTRERVVRLWCEDLRARHGVACAYALHLPDAHGDERNFHAHVIVSARRSDGLALKEKTRELDNPRTGGVEVEAWRVAWAARCDEALTQTSTAPRVDMRSWKRRLEAEGLPNGFIEPQEHLGPARAAAERRGQRTAAGERNRRRRRRRAARAPMLREHEATKRKGEEMSGIEKTQTRQDPQGLEALARRAAAQSHMKHTAKIVSPSTGQRLPTRKAGMLDKAQSSLDGFLSGIERSARGELGDEER
ncbi:MobA/MobL family protein [Parvibaculum sedimenti]|nr:MobA/MobL family protein [Parvibaculum sedimenti]